MATLSMYCRPTIPRTTPYLSRSTSNPNSTLIHQKIRINPSLALCNRTKKRGGLCCKSMFGLGVPELVVIAGVAALVFGPKKLPEIGRGIGKTVKSFQQAAKEFESELKKEPDPAIDSPVEKPTAAAEEEKEIKVSATKESL